MKPSDDKQHEEPFSNIRQEDVNAFVGSLRRQDTPWADGCAALIVALWGEVEAARYEGIEHEHFGCHVAKTGIYAPSHVVSNALPRIICPVAQSCPVYPCACGAKNASECAASVPSTTPRNCSRGGEHEIDQCHKCGAIFAASAIARNAARYAARRRTIFETRLRLQVGGPRPSWDEFVKEYDEACDKETAVRRAGGDA